MLIFILVLDNYRTGKHKNAYVGTSVEDLSVKVDAQTSSGSKWFFYTIEIWEDGKLYNEACSVQDLKSQIQEREARK